MTAELSFLISVGTIGIVTLAALAYLGWGCTVLLLPARLAPEGLLWAPFVGYALMAVVFHGLNIALLDGVSTAVALFVIATAINLVAIRSDSYLRAPLRPTLCLGAVTVAVYLLGVFPLFGLGQLTAIARNYDLIDVYDATAAYVIDYPVGAIASQSPPNPLALMVTSASTLSNGWGFSYLHALISILTRLSPIETQSASMSFMHALLVPGAFLFFRRVIGLPSGAAIVVGAGLGTHALLLAMLLFGFGNHTTMLALLPPVLAATLFALDGPRPRAVPLAALLLSTIPLSYWPGFTFYLPPVLLYTPLGLLLGFRPAAMGRPRRAPAAVPAGVAEDASVNGAAHARVRLVAVGGGPDDARSAVQTGSDRPAAPSPSAHPPGANGAARPSPRAAWLGEWSVAAPAGRRTLIRLGRRLLERCAVLAAICLGSVLLGLPGYERVVRTLLQVRELSEGFGVPSFADATLAFGFSYWTWPTTPDVRDLLGHEAGTTLLTLQNAALVLAALLGAYGLVRLPRRPRAVMASLIVAYAALLFYFRFVSSYPYAFLKALTFVAFVPLGLTVVGLHRADAAARSAPGWARRAGRAALGATLSLLGALVLVNAALATAFFVDQPQTWLTGSVLPPSSLELKRVADVLPPGSSVFISETPPLSGQTASALAFFLRRHPLYGNIRTLESALDNPPPRGSIPDYGVLGANEDPETRGYEAGDLVWANEEVRVYRRGAIISHLRLEGDDTRRITSDRPLRLLATGAGISLDQPSRLDADSAPDAAPHQLNLELATLVPQQVRLRIDGEEQLLSLPAGLSRLSTASRPLPIRAVVSVDAAEPVFVRSISLRRAPGAAAALSSLHDVLVAVPEVALVGDRLRLDLRYAGAEPLAERMALGVNIGGTAAVGRDWVDLGWWGTDMRRSNVQLELDPRTGDAAARTPLEQLRVNKTVGQVRDGDYTASLNFWEPGLAELGWHSAFFELAHFRVRNGQIVSFESRAAPVLVVPLRYAYPVAPAVAERFRPEVQAIQARVPAGAEVMIAPGLYRMPQPLTALVQGLSGAQLRADFVAGARYVEPGRVYDYAVLAPTDDPAALGYAPTDRLWSGPTFRLYRRSSLLAHLDLHGAGGYPRVAPGEEHTVLVGPETVAFGAAAPTGRASPGPIRQVVLTLASLDQTRAVIRVEGEAPRAVVLPGGLARYRTEPLSAPGSITVAGDGSAPFYVVAVDLTPATTPTSQLILDRDALLLAVGVQRTDETSARVSLRWASGLDPSRPFYSGVNVNGYTEPDRKWFSLAWWGVPLRGREVVADVDLAAGSLAARGDGGGLDVSTERFSSLQDGDYDATLSPWEATLAGQGWPTPFLPLFTFSVRGGRVAEFVPEQTELVVVPLVLPDAGPAGR